MDARTTLLPVGTWSSVHGTRHLMISSRRDRDGTVVGTACRLWLPGIDTDVDDPAAARCERCAAIPPRVRRMACLDSSTLSQQGARVQDWVEAVYAQLCTVGATNLLGDVLCGRMSLHTAADWLREIGRDVPDHPAFAGERGAGAVRVTSDAR